MNKSMNKAATIFQILLISALLSACKHKEDPEPAVPVPTPTVTVTATPKPVVTPSVTPSPTVPPCFQGGFSCGTKFLSGVSNSCFTFKDSSGELMRRLYVRFLVTADGVGVKLGGTEPLVSANLKTAIQDPSLSGRKAVGLVTGEDGRVCLTGTFDSYVQIAKGIRFASEVMFESGGVARSYPLLNKTINIGDQLACAIGSSVNQYYVCNVDLGGTTIQVGQSSSYRISH